MLLIFCTTICITKNIFTENWLIKYFLRRFVWKNVHIYRLCLCILLWEYLGENILITYKFMNIEVKTPQKLRKKSRKNCHMAIGLCLCWWWFLFVPWLAWFGFFSSKSTSRQKLLTDANSEQWWALTGSRSLSIRIREWWTRSSTNSKQKSKKWLSKKFW